MRPKLKCKCHYKRKGEVEWRRKRGSRGGERRGRREKKKEEVEKEEEEDGRNVREGIGRR